MKDKVRGASFHVDTNYRLTMSFLVQMGALTKDFGLPSPPAQ